MFRFRVCATAVIAVLCLAVQPGAAAPLQIASSDPGASSGSGASPLLHMVQYLPVPDDDDDDDGDGADDGDDGDDEECLKVGPVTVCE